MSKTYSHTPRTDITATIPDFLKETVDQNDWDLILACKDGKLDDVRDLIESCKSKADLDINFIATPLGVALDARQIIVAEYLESKIKDESVLANHFLQFANSGDWFSLSWLLSRGYKPACATQCVAMAASNAHSDVAQLFISMGGRVCNTVMVTPNEKGVAAFESYEIRND